MKIALFHNLPNGGAKRSMYEWIKQIHLKHRVDLFMYSKDEDIFCNINEFVTKKYIFGSETKLKGILKKIYTILKYEILSLKIAKHINKNHYDCVFVLQCKVTNTPPLIRHLNKSTIYYCQEPLTRILEPHYPRKTKNFFLNLFIYFFKLIFIFYEKKNAKTASSILCNSFYSKESIYKAFGKYPKLVYQGIDTKKFYKQIRVKKNKKNFITIGHLTPSKGHDFLIHSLSYVNQSIRPTLTIIYNLENDGYKKELTSLANEKKVNVIFLKSITDDELLNQYNKAYFVLCAARLEPAGLTPIEAMACGTPTIAVAEAGLREKIKHNYNGILVERNVFLFAKKVQKLLNDNSIYKSLVENGLLEVKNYWTSKYSSKNIENELIATWKMKNDKIKLS